MSTSTKPPAGMRDFLPADTARRQYVMDIVREAYERHHFSPLETPALERIDTLTGKYGDEGDQLMFKVLKRAQKLTRALENAPVEPASLADMGLRYDLTVPLCRVVAQYQNELPRVFKRYQLAPVWRADRPARGRFREFYQCDVDIIGSESFLVEVDVITAAGEALSALGFEDFTVRVNDRQLLSAIAEAAGIDSSRSDQAFVSIDKLDKIGPEGVTAELEREGFSSEAVSRLFDLIGLRGGAKLHPQQALDRLESALGEDASPVISRLRSIIDAVASLDMGGKIRFDPALARGLSYYTGPIFEINLGDLASSVGGGGRYDNLIGMFLGRDIPACGISLGIERLIMLMNERDMFGPDLVSCDVYVAQFEGVPPGPGLQLASSLRSRGLRVDVSPDAQRLKKQFRSAERMNARVVALIGPGEIENDSVVIKEMATGIQTVVSSEEVVSHIQRLIASETPVEE